MPISRPTLAELDTATRGDIESRLQGATPGLRRSILGGLARALAGAIHGLYGLIAARALQATPYSATGTDLERWASLWGLGRKQPTSAAGSVTASGASGVAVPSGTGLQSPTGDLYATSADFETVGGTGAVSIVALQSGSAGNRAAGSELTWVNPPAGLVPAVTVGAAGISGGSDLESDAGLYSRLRLRIQSPGHGGNTDDYRNWALQVAGITRAWVFPLYDGPGSVRVYVANDSYDGANLASGGDVAAVQAYIDALKPVTVVKENPAMPGEYINGFEAVAPVATPVDYEIAITPNTTENQANVTAALAELYYREAQPEAGVALNRSIVAIGATTGLDDFTLVEPASAPTAAAGHILTLGSITWL